MKYGLIGGSLKHSFSKEIHEKLEGYEYELKELSEEELDPFLKEAAFCGINVTIPYKKAVIPYLNEISDRAKRIGAVNTVVNCGRMAGKDRVPDADAGDRAESLKTHAMLYGDNTDYAGLGALVLRVVPGLKGAKVLILGTGGTSLTAKVVCEDLGAGRILRVSRNGANDDTGETGSDDENVISYEAAAALHADADLIINTTPVGMFPRIDGCPICLEPFKKLKGVVDVVYNPLRTKLVLDARSRGVRAEGGLYMLVAQAEAASKLFLSENVQEADDDKYRSVSSITGEQNAAADQKMNEDLTKCDDSEIENSDLENTAKNGKERTSTRVEHIFRELSFERENLVLTGMPGAGKTTIGRILAEKLTREFIDTDQRILEKTGRTPAEIIRDDGENVFRDIESEVIRELAALTGVVIATGGGAVLRKENVSALRQNGRIIFINTPVEKLKATSDRPLSDTTEKLRELYEKRLEHYLFAADLVIENRKEPEDACSTILGS